MPLFLDVLYINKALSAINWLYFALILHGYNNGVIVTVGGLFSIEGAAIAREASER